MDEQAKALAQLPELPQENRKVWDDLCKRMSDCKSRHGLYLMLCGWSYREASRAIGIQHTTLGDAAHRHGLTNVLHGTDRVITNHRAIAIATTEEMLERAREGKLSEESLRDLAVTAGISSDKVRDFERQQANTGGALAFLEQLAGSLKGAGMRLDVSLSPAEPESGYADRAVNGEGLCIAGTPQQNAPARIPASADALRHDSGAAEPLEGETVNCDRD